MTYVLAIDEVRQPVTAIPQPDGDVGDDDDSYDWPYDGPGEDYSDDSTDDCLWSEVTPF